MDDIKLLVKNKKKEKKKRIGESDTNETNITIM